MNVLYEDSVEPVYTDGRDIDSDVAQLKGEAASQTTEGQVDEHLRKTTVTRKTMPSTDPDDPTYYGHPMLKEPVWEWAIPAYYFVGGLSGAAMALGAAAQMSRSPHADSLAQRCHLIGFIGASVSGGLLIQDLGRPARFLNMLRVFRPTSPMNMGAWILTVAGGTAAGTVLLSRQTGKLRKLGRAIGYACGVSGLLLATYTGVLVANSAIPIWQQSRKVLPLLFGASAIASVGCAFDVFDEDPTHRRITSMFGTVGRVAELSASIVMEKQASVVPRVGLPFKQGLSGAMWKTAEVLTGASLVVSLLGKPTRTRRISGGVLGGLGSLLMRFAVQHAGVVSARDARASFHSQRAGYGAAEVTSK